MNTFAYWTKRQGFIILVVLLAAASYMGKFAFEGVVNYRERVFKASSTTPNVSVPSNLAELAGNLRRAIAHPDDKGRVLLQENSLVYRGSSQQFQQALLDRKHLQFAVIGGSTSAGHGVRPNTNFFDLLGSIMSAPLNASGMEGTFHNFGIGATDSKYFALCISEQLDLTKYDLLFLELVVNDVTAPGWIEEVVREVWRSNPAIQIVLTSFITPKLIFDLTYRNEPFRCKVNLVFSSWLDVARHYDIPMIQWQHVCRVNKSKEELVSQYTAGDGFHPSESAHLLMAEFILNYFVKVIDHLLNGELPTNELREIPAPLYRRTWIDATQCFITVSRPFMQNDKLKKAMISKSNDASFQNWNLMAKFIRKGLELEAEATYVALRDKGSFAEFNLTNGFQKVPHCMKEGSQTAIRLFYAYRLCSGCVTGRVIFDATFQLADQTILKVKYEGVISTTPNHANWVDEMHPVEENFIHPGINCDPTLEKFNSTERGPSIKSCVKPRISSPVKSLMIRVVLDTAGYPFLLNGIIVAYDCC